ncbi:MAG: DJ-1/PfpI family protein [Methanomassiliicoccus sp.]|nr:DJ-1/PfpI family protein [Methanomassiliicoccus sp.]
MIYDGCVRFEVIITAYFVQQRGEVVAFGLDTGEVRSAEGSQLRPDVSLSELDPDALEAFIVPGGQPEGILDGPPLAEKPQVFKRPRNILATICAGPYTSPGPGAGGKDVSSSILNDQTIFRQGPILMTTLSETVTS